MSDEEATANCIEGLNRVKKIARRERRHDLRRAPQQQDRPQGLPGRPTRFGVDIVKAVASPRVKLLYDIYHMQIMEGDLIRTIRDNHEYLAHFHTGGVPGRHELDGTQEVDLERRGNGHRRI